MQVGSKNKSHDYEEVARTKPCNLIRRFYEEGGRREPDTIRRADDSKDVDSNSSHDRTSVVINVRGSDERIYDTIMAVDSQNHSVQDDTNLASKYLF